MDSLTWDSSSEARLKTKRTVKVSVEACALWWECGQWGQGDDEGEGVVGDLGHCDKSTAK